MLSPRADRRSASAEPGALGRAPWAGPRCGVGRRGGPAGGREELLAATEGGTSAAGNDARTCDSMCSSQEMAPFEQSSRARCGNSISRGRSFLAGRVSDVETLYGGIDLLALTSDSEGTPMVVLEAMAYALPVVATRVGGIPDQVVEGETALLFPAGDVHSFSAELERLVREASLRQRLGCAGYARARAEFSADAWAGKHVMLYERALRGDRR